MLLLPFADLLPKAMAASSPSSNHVTCGDLKAVYNEGSCCGSPETEVPVQIGPNPTERLTGSNPCENKKALTTGAGGMDNKDCFAQAVAQAGEQSGADVTAGYTGTMAASANPITEPYYKTALCPVNVHWHLGAEHRSAGEQSGADVTAG